MRAKGLGPAVHQHQGIYYEPPMRRGRGSSLGRSIEVLSVETATSGKAPKRSTKPLKATPLVCEVDSRWHAECSASAPHGAYTVYAIRC